MEPDSSPANEHLALAEKIRTGEYFQEARAMYDLTVHDPMAERYLYIFITLLALFTSLAAMIAVQGLYPLQASVPFIVSTNDILEDFPHVKTLMTHKGDTPGEALLRFMAQNYVTFREEYNIDSLDRDVNGIRSQSAENVFKEFQQYIDRRNPDSPIAQYQRHTTRKINVLDTKILDKDSAIQVTYEAVLESKSEIKKSQWQANISFNFSGVALDEETDKVKPVSFIVTQYRTKRLQDEK